jgi:hypothetical protein
VEAADLTGNYSTRSINSAAALSRGTSARLVAALIGSQLHRAVSPFSLQLMAPAAQVIDRHTAKDERSSSKVRGIVSACASSARS